MLASRVGANDEDGHGRERITVRTSAVFGSSLLDRGAGPHDRRPRPLRGGAGRAGGCATLRRLIDPARPLRLVDTRVLDAVCRALGIGIGDLLVFAPTFGVHTLAPRHARHEPSKECTLRHRSWTIGARDPRKSRSVDTRRQAKTPPPCPSAFRAEAIELVRVSGKGTGHQADRAFACPDEGPTTADAWAAIDPHGAAHDRGDRVGTVGASRLCVYSGHPAEERRRTACAATTVAWPANGLHTAARSCTRVRPPLGGPGGGNDRNAARGLSVTTSCAPRPGARAATAPRSWHFLYDLCRYINCAAKNN